MALPGYKEIVDLVKKGATIEAQEKIMELREAAISLQEENLNLREELRELKAKLALKKELNFDGSVYWQGGGDERDGPFCPSCNDSKSKLIRLQEYFDKQWRCKVCHTRYKRKI